MHVHLGRTRLATWSWAQQRLLSWFALSALTLAALAHVHPAQAAASAGEVVVFAARAPQGDLQPPQFGGGSEPSKFDTAASTEDKRADETKSGETAKAGDEQVTQSGADATKPAASGAASDTGTREKSLNVFSMVMSAVAGLVLFIFGVTQLAKGLGDMNTERIRRITARFTT